MSSPAVLSSLLSSLPPRPPTPPREAHHELAALARPSLGPVDTRLSLHTPPGFQSPASSAATTSISRRIQKKVGFSARTEYKDPPVFVDGDGVRQHPTPVSLPRSPSKPIKSILKVTAALVPSLLDSAARADFDPADPYLNLAAMLESTLQQLAGGDRDSKLDAYLMLTRACKASNNLPDRVALQAKMTLFTQFMQRDIVARTPEGNLDPSLTDHALNLLNTFLSFPAIASTISSDFGVFIIDHCIRSFEDPSTPKSAARRLMLVISQQNFSPKVMTSDRVGRLVSSLHNLEEPLKGKTIIQSRIFVYRKLVEQSGQLMIVHSDWLLDLFTDMLSNLRDIRSAAISLGLRAAYSIGHEKQLTRKVIEAFNLQSEDRRYIQYYEERLKLLAKDKHESAVVPEIWSVVILLLRIRLDQWEYTSPWLHIIQSCFNSTDYPTKIAANHAWARLVYLLHLDERALPKNVSILMAPLISQLKRKGSGRTSAELRQAVLGGVCNFFYYAFRPSTPTTLLDTYWDASVRPVVSKLLEPASEAADDTLHQAGVILGGLFDCTTPRQWKVDHIEKTSLVKPEELPPIDSKWIRRNTSKVFGVVQPILVQDFLALARPDSSTYGLWRNLVSTVASAAAKEIKISRDTALFVTGALTLLQTIWKRGVLAKEDAEGRLADFLLSVRTYLDIMVRSLGLLPFTEKTGKQQAPGKAPISTLFSMLSTLPPGVPDDKEFADFFGSVFAPFFANKGGKARMDLAQDLISVVPMDAPRPYGSWLLVANNIVSWLEPSHHSFHSTTSAGETPVGHEYRDVVKVLERGIRSTPNLPSEHWQSLFYAAFERVREETGDAGVAIVVVEPLAKVLVEHLAAWEIDDNRLSCVRYVTELASVATRPRDRQAVDAARKRLWGTVLAGSRSSSYDTFDSLYKAVGDVLGHLYANFDPAEADSTVQLLKETGGFFDRCNRELFLKAMIALQDGFLPWFEDKKKLLGGSTSSVFTATKSLWDKISHLLADMDHPEQQLQCLDRFFCASFASCHRGIVNSAISLWNRLFEGVGHLDYPEDLKAALVQLQLHADIALPGLETSSAEFAGQHPSFIDSFEEGFSFARLPSTRSSGRKETSLPPSSQSKSPASSRPVTRSAQKGRTPANQRTPKPRLRHDDSQVQFAAIEPPSAFGSPLESQVLTERQKEVRDRQRETAGLFSDIRPNSPGTDSKEAHAQMLPEAPRMRQAATPEPERAFDDYVSSTPTPRRGQAMLIPEHDMMDPPSSPPELRGNPLAAEIRSRSASHSLLEEWQFSSSPVSGSPNPHRQVVVPDPSSQRGFVSVVSLPEVEDDGPLVPSSPLKEEERAELPSAMDEVIEDSMVFDRMVAPAEAPQGPSKKRVEELPVTPRRSARISRPRTQETPTSKSDAIEFTDAPTSPLPSTSELPDAIPEAVKKADPEPSRAMPAAAASFELSQVDETSFLRLVVELDASKTDPSEYDRSSATGSPGATGQKSPVIECIVVEGSPEQPERNPSPVEPVPSRITRASSAASAASSSAELEEMSGSQMMTRSGRKRASSRIQQSVPKRQRHDSTASSGEVADSQTAPAPEARAPSVEVQASDELPTAVKGGVKADEAQEERIPSSSAEPSDDEGAASQESNSLDFEAGKAENEMDDEMDDEMVESDGDDRDVQSQIALEISNSQRLDEDSRPGSRDGSPAVFFGEELMQVDDVEEGEAETEEEAKEEAEEHAVDTTVGQVTVTEVTEVTEVEEPAAPEPSEGQKLMGLLRGGLDGLRLAQLSRDEVYQIEDLFMDMRRELYEAERRGRKPGSG